MTYRKILYAALSAAALLTVTGCVAYDPYYHPLAANPYYDEPYYGDGYYGGAYYAGPGPYAPAVVVGGRPYRYRSHHWNRWGDDYD